MDFSFWLPIDKNMGLIVLKSGVIGKHSRVHNFLMGLLLVLLNTITVSFIESVAGIANQD